MKRAYVNGEPIAGEAVRFELERLMRFYAEHGMGEADLRKNLDRLTERAQEQAIGAKLLLARAAQLDLPVPEEKIDAKVAEVTRQLGGREAFVRALAERKVSEDDFRKSLVDGCRVDLLVERACASVAEPTNGDVESYYRDHPDEFPAGCGHEGHVRPLAEVADSIRDLLRHAARGIATEALVEELRQKAVIEYR